MAAILCSGLAEVFGAVGQVICLPCKACGFACTSVGEILTSPFFPYLAVTFLLQVPVVVLGVRGAGATHSGYRYCDGSWTRWFWINVALAIVHLVASVYIVHRIREDNSGTDVINTGVTPSTTTQAETGVKNVEGGGKIESDTYYAATPLDGSVGRQNSIAVIPDGAETEVTRHSSFARIRQVLCYDAGVAAYIVVVVLWCIWQALGAGKVFAGDCDAAESKLVYSLLCGFLYMSLAGMGFACSLCCLR